MKLLCAARVRGILFEIYCAGEGGGIYRFSVAGQDVPREVYVIALRTVSAGSAATALDEDR